MPVYKHILYATDLSEETKEISQKAGKFAELFNARLTLVHAIEPIPAYGYPGITDIESPLIEQAQKDIAKLGKELNVKKEDQRVEFGSVKHQVLRIAKECGADLILVGSHGRHGLSALLGSSASAIVQGADCDVFVIRFKE